MARISSQKAVEMVGNNRYDLIYIASRRARELKAGWYPKIKQPGGPVLTALREIEQGLVGREYLRKDLALTKDEYRNPR